MVFLGDVERCRTQRAAEFRDFWVGISKLRQRLTLENSWNPSTSGAERIPHARDHFRAVFPRECDEPKQSHMLDMKLTGITRRNQTSEPSAD